MAFLFSGQLPEPDTPSERLPKVVRILFHWLFVLLTAQVQGGTA
jgi:hypothetical protein